jgi:LAO/AO transport system kinase
MDIVQRSLLGERLAVARLISVMESGSDEARRALATLYPHTGRAHIVGVTGSPGAGKSTLVNEMAKLYRMQGHMVGIIAVDPTSPFSGGAILGDRIRMRDIAVDAGIFIRSMATRGSLGGLARATADAVNVLDAAGYPVILVETVGAGQSEVDIARMAHTTVVAEMPSAGDDIQAIKAGILEIADILVVNKADLPGADNAVAALRAMLDLGEAHSEWHHAHLERVEGVVGVAAGGAGLWRTPVLKTVATRGDGVEELVSAVQAHQRYLRESGLLQRRERERVEDGLRRILRHTLLERLLQGISEQGVERTVERVVARELDPYAAAELLITQASIAGEG